MKRIVFYFLIFSGLIACKQEQSIVEEPDIKALRANTKPTEVILGNSRKDNFELRINSNGTIAAAYNLEIVSNSSGYLNELHISNGKIAKANEVIAQLENSNEGLSLERAQIAYQKAQVSYESEALGYSNLTEDAKDNLMLSSGLKDAELNLKEAKINLDKTIIKAPISGMIAQIEKKVGDRISVGDKICQIYTPNRLIMEAKVLETDYGDLKVGLQADVFPLALKQQTFTATLVEINPLVDDNGMVSVKLRLNETSGLLPGMNAQCIIRVPVTESILVPKDAIVIKSGKPVVFTFEQGLAKWNYVETGLENGTDVQITSGLEPGKQVILTNNLQLAHDAKVSIVNTSVNNN